MIKLLLIVCFTFFLMGSTINQKSIDSGQEVNTSKVQLKDRSIEKQKTYITKKIFVKEDNSSLWTALFGLATIGILYMFLSLHRIRLLKESQDKVIQKQNQLEEKQNTVLSNLGKNIHAKATTTQKKATELAEKIKESDLHDDVKKVIENETELIDITEDFLSFLQLKSKKIVIKNEIFNFNNVINEVIGTLYTVSNKHKTELIVDIEPRVPYRISADSSHLGQVLISLLDYCIQNKSGNYVRLMIDADAKAEESMDLIIDIDSNMQIEDKKNFFNTSYDEKSKEYTRLGLFVAKELVELMNGKLTISTVKERDILRLVVPIEEPNRDRRMYRLTHRDTIYKRVMIADMNHYASMALQKRFEYFRIETTLIDVTNIKHVLLHISNIEIVVIDRKLLNKEIIEILKRKKEELGLKIIVLENLYETYYASLPSLADALITKPFSPSYIYEILEKLYGTSFQPIAKVKSIENRESVSLPVHKERFESKEGFTLSDFKHFGGHTLLLVEDNLINQKLVLSVLAQSDMKIIVASNGQEAVNMVNKHGTQIDFILMDINMPVLDGFSATKQIRENHQFNSIPIVSLTALVAEHEIEKMLNTGMNGYLSKPLRVNRLYTAFDMFIKSNIRKEDIERKSVADAPAPDIFQPDEGLVYMQGNKLFYHEVLREFLDAYASSDVKFEKYLENKEYEKMKLLFLDLRGISGTIGSKEIFNLVSKIHKDLVAKEYGALHGYVAAYKIKLGYLKSAIEKYLSA